MGVQHVLQHGSGSNKSFMVVSVLLQVGLVPDNPDFAEVWDEFPAYTPNVQESVTKFITNPFYGAFPRDKSFFAFPGSLTQPPYTNGTVSIVFQSPVLISRQQRDMYRKHLNATSQGGFFHYGPGKGP